MQELKKILVEAANAPKSSAVKFTQENEAELCKTYSISRQNLRSIAVIFDKQAKLGYKEPVAEEPKKTATKKKEAKIPSVEISTSKKKKPKPKKKAVAKKSSKKKS